MKLILNWSKQQWLGMDAYQKSAVNFGRTSYFYCIQSLKMRNKETNRDLAEFFGNKWDGFR